MDIVGQGKDQCTSGFPSEPTPLFSLLSVNLGTTTRIIPHMNFTCNGSIVRWTVAGIMGNGSLYPLLQVWRRVNDQIYIEVDSTHLGICRKSLRVKGNIYECDLFGDDQLAVQAGDNIGIVVPSSLDFAFQIYLQFPSEGLINYVYRQDVTSGADLSNPQNNFSSQPQIEVKLQLNVIPTTLSMETTVTEVLESNSFSAMSVTVTVVGGTIALFFLVTIILILVFGVLHLKKHKASLIRQNHEQHEYPLSGTNPAYGSKIENLTTETFPFTHIPPYKCCRQLQASESY